MSHNSIQSLPPKMALQFAERARAGEGCRLTPDSDIWEFVQGNTVICIIGLANPTGHILKDARRAQELRDRMKSP